MDEPTKLSIVEQAKLENLELVIDENKNAVLKVAHALRTINAERLYRTTHGTFDDYVAERFDFQRAHAYRLIDYADVLENLSPIGDTPNESQSRELKKLPADEQVEAWSEAKDAADGNPTAADVREAVQRRTGKKPREPQAFDWLGHFDDAAQRVQDALDNLDDADQLGRVATKLHQLAELAEEKSNYADVR